MIWNPLVLLATLLGVPNWLIYLAFFAVVFYVWSTWTYSTFERMGVPFMKPVPLFGNLLYVMKMGFAADEKLVQKFGKVFGLYEGRMPVLVVCEPSMIREITVKEFDYFVNRRTVGLPMNEEFMSAVSILKDDEWKGARSVITPSFSGSKMKKMMGLINECGRELNESLTQLAKEGNGEVEVKYLSGCFTMDVIARTMFGINVSSMKEGKNSEFVKHAKGAFEDFSLTNPIVALCFLFPKFGEFLQDVVKYGVFPKDSMKFFKQNIERILEMRQNMKEKPLDFLQLMLDAHTVTPDEIEHQKASAFDDTNEISEHFQKWRVGKRALSRQEILANALIFFLAGYETTATAMSWMMYCLALNPNCQEKLREEVCQVLQKQGGEPSYEAVANMQYLDQVFCETLRLYPSVQRSDRVCQQDCVIEDISIPKDMIVNIGIWAVHRNEEFWPEPEKFDPDRFAPENKDSIVPYSWIPFGSGPRNCIGMRLAILEAKLAMVHLIQKFKFVRTTNTEYPPQMKIGGFSSPKSGKIFVGVQPI